MTIPSGTKVRTGFVEANFDGQAGVRQYEILDKPNPTWFEKRKDVELI